MGLRRSSGCVFVLLLCGILPAHAQLRSFQKPALNGYALSYCDSDGRRCGETVAKAWCQKRGYGYASEWQIARATGFSSQTVRLDDGSICRGAGCDGFARITCGGRSHSHAYLMPSLGAAAHATVISPDQRNADTVVESISSADTGVKSVPSPHKILKLGPSPDKVVKSVPSPDKTVKPVAYDVKIPNCRRDAAGSFLCDSVPAYQQCRARLKAGKVLFCRANLAFVNQRVEPQQAASGDYALQLDSSATAIVYRGHRGRGKLKGEARFHIQFAAPKINKLDWCIARKRYIYHPTGPRGGVGKVDDRADCSRAVEGSFAPQQDDLLEAYDSCDRRNAWGNRLQQPIELLVAAFYEIGSSRPDFVPGRAADHMKVLAPFVVVQAPMRVTCKKR